MIAPHNTLTYLPPIRWWMRLFTPFARCQRRLVRSELADIRIRWHKGEWYISHGLVRYCTLCFGLSLLRVAGFKMVRLLLGHQPRMKDIEAFLDLKTIFDSFHDLDFYGGRDKKTWEKMVDLPDIEVQQRVSSMDGHGLEKLSPILYDKLHQGDKQLFMRTNKHSQTYWLFDFL